MVSPGEPRGDNALAMPTVPPGLGPSRAPADRLGGYDA
jgi:hypothetical protein